MVCLESQPMVCLESKPMFIDSSYGLSRGVNLLSWSVERESAYGLCRESAYDLGLSRESAYGLSI